MSAEATPLIAQLEDRVRRRGVRVEERLALLRQLASNGGLERVVRRREELLAAARRALSDVRVEASAR